MDSNQLLSLLGPDHQLLVMALQLVGGSVDELGSLIPAQHIRVVLTGGWTGSGILCAITRGGWLVVRLDDETRTDEWQSFQVALQSVA